MSQRSATEVTTKFATTVDELTDAWAFIMEHLADVGDAPNVTITPCWPVSVAEFPDGGDVGRRYFEVTVSGMVEQS